MTCLMCRDSTVLDRTEQHSIMSCSEKINIHFQDFKTPLELAKFWSIICVCSKISEESN